VALTGHSVSIERVEPEPGFANCHAGNQSPVHHSTSEQLHCFPTTVLRCGSRIIVNFDAKEHHSIQKEKV
jgi:hypothetical protein